MPLEVERGVFVPVVQGKKKILSVNQSTGKLILVHDQQQKKYLVDVCERLMRGCVC